MTLPHRDTTSRCAETDHWVAGGCAVQEVPGSKRPKVVRTLCPAVGEGFDPLDYAGLYDGF